MCRLPLRNSFESELADGLRVELFAKGERLTAHGMCLLRLVMMRRGEDYVAVEVFGFVGGPAR